MIGDKRRTNFKLKENVTSIPPLCDVLFSLSEGSATAAPGSLAVCPGFPFALKREYDASLIAEVALVIVASGEVVAESR